MSARRREPPGQQGLFGPLHDPGEVAPAVADATLRRLADALPEDLRLGTSSWNFPGWRGLVYADDAPVKHLSRRGLAAYSQHPLLRTVGVDRTFYAPVPANELADYAAQVPDDFRFLVKAWGELLTPIRRDGTQNPHYLDPDALVAECVRPAQDGMRRRLGVLLLQFPPQGREVTDEPALFAKLLRAALERLPDDVPVAVELRDRELLCDDYAEALAATGAVHGFVVHPQMPSLARQRRAVPDRGPRVVRWMLRHGLAYEQAKRRYQPFDALRDPTPDVRAAIAELAHDAALRAVPCTVVVNNKAEGSAPLSVFELVRAIVGDVDLRVASKPPTG